MNCLKSQFFMLAGHVLLFCMFFLFGHSVLKPSKILETQCGHQVVSPRPCTNDHQTLGPATLYLARLQDGFTSFVWSVYYPTMSGPDMVFLEFCQAQNFLRSECINPKSSTSVRVWSVSQFRHPNLTAKSKLYSDIFKSAQASDIGYLDPRYNSITWFRSVAEMSLSP